MKILFCSPYLLKLNLGGAKVLLELGEAMKQNGDDCHIAGLAEIFSDYQDCPQDKIMLKYPHYLKAYIQKNSHKFDVVDYDYRYLPFDRNEFSSSLLMVARSTLLDLHYDYIKLPNFLNLRSILGQLLKGGRRKKMQKELFKNALITLRQSDLINVSNYDDLFYLIDQGFDASKVAVLPYGLSYTVKKLFRPDLNKEPEKKTVVFVGTFDRRKGACELPHIFQVIDKNIEDVQFKLLGIKGTYRKVKDIENIFSKHLRKKIEIVLEYPPEDIFKLLSGCTVGVFPSHLEGFGFGVLEMLYASIPVIAYDVPGPSIMLPPEYLVKRGDANQMAQKVINLLRNREHWLKARKMAIQQAKLFSWEDIAHATSSIYLKKMR